MRIACLQFAPSLGKISQNIQRAEALLRNAAPQNLDLLILPELAFTGYSFGSLSGISPHLEATAAGPSTIWASSTARRLNCYVTVGYPEIAHASEDRSVSRYNSAVMVSPAGSVIANYRKHHLYTTDETWAEEGRDGFFVSDVSALGNVAMGIFVQLEGMDINPYRYIAPFHRYEFATHVLASSATLVLLPMAWLTSEPPLTLQTAPELPDTATIQYWQSRLQPLLEGNGDGREILVVVCNRSGSEGKTHYAGTSSVIGFQSGAIRRYGVLGRGVEDLLVVET
ncbi:MAG: Carbon-nitrogen hydrolase [Geoglossum simile]|nr:MAG: Carbon-nitrogen hydrolase [Geoglossum simile]